MPEPSTDQKSVPQVLGELKDMTVSYAKQETIDPLRSIGRFIGFGVTGSFVLGVGLCMLGLGFLRLLQTETDDTFTGNWSWAPYLITMVVLLLFAGLAARAIKEKRHG